MYTIVKKRSKFNWVVILSHTMMQEWPELDFKILYPSSPPQLFMSSYLLDIICVNNPFLGIGWAWSI
jgi:hypothetical protein